MMLVVLTAYANYENTPQELHLQMQAARRDKIL